MTMKRLKEWVHEPTKTKVRIFNLLLATKLADGLCTMACIYGIFFLVTIPLRWQHPADPMGWLTWGVQTFFQGIALPVLGLTSKLNGDRLEALVCETHDTVMSILCEVHLVVMEIRTLMAEVKVILQALHCDTKEGNDDGN